MIFQLPTQHYTRIVKHFASARAAEVLALQASPILGMALGGIQWNWFSITQVSLLIVGSLALTAHIFVFNDWVGHQSDLHDPRRSALVFTQHGISRNEVLGVVIALLGIAIVALAAVGSVALLLGSAIAILSVLYSCSSFFGKKTPVMGTLNHLLGGSLHFLLGYSLFHTLDMPGLVLSLFFGLVFAGGHLNQEVRDYEGDMLNGIRTNAVVFGCKRTFIASFATFSAAYAMIAGLVALGTLPHFLLGSVIGWLLHTVWSVQVIQRGLGFESAQWLQRRYRMVFALIGLAILIGTML
jgi:4-hydroxybenzoate polyprenyltransferase